MSSWKVFLLIGIGVWMSAVYGAFRFNQRRTHHIYKYRSTTLSLTTSYGLGVVSLFVAISEIKQSYQCAVFWIVFFVFGFGLAANIHCTRMLRSLFKLKVVYEKLRAWNEIRQGELKGDQIPIGWYERHEHWISTKNLSIIFATIFLAFTVLGAASSMLTIQSGGVMAVTCELNSMTNFSFSVGMLFLGLQIVLSISLRTKADSYLIQIEFFISTIILLGCVFVFWISDAFDFFNSLILYVGFTLVGCGFIFFPHILYWRALDRNRKNKVWDSLNMSEMESKEEASDEKFDLEWDQGANGMLKLLRDDHGFEAFKIFLINELGVENLLYWKEVDDLYQRMSDVFDNPNIDEEQIMKVFDRMETIYYLYLADNAKFKINISARTLKKVKRVYESEELLVADSVPEIFAAYEALGFPRDNLADLFHECTTAIVLLMYNGPFLKFKSSPIYDNLMWRKQTKHRTSRLSW